MGLKLALLLKGQSHLDQGLYLLSRSGPPKQSEYNRLALSALYTIQGTHEHPNL